ncbi:MAG TPA: hydantoinase/oxoprolinase family protein, partial [Thermoanaerobaculia bacterium]|nr:hydantoinase/oxoprolinase family protein [Thermoanaerobaculia bacterium]
IIVPVVNVSAIGAGGGSIVWVDTHGVLKVGPQSAGALPGPVCYGRGGDQPTVTDCYLLTGLIDGDHFLGGRMKLDRAAAERALEKIADRIGFTGPDKAVKAAEATLRVTTAVMATEMAKNIAQRGEDIRDYALVPFGGAGPTQANLIADDIGIGTIIVPAAPSTFCALGALLSDVKRDYVRSKYVDLADANAADVLAQTFDAIEADGREWIASEGAILGETRFERVVDMRYGEQAYDLAVSIDDALRVNLDLAKLGELFHQAHERSYNFRDLETRIEITTVRLRVIGKVPDIGLPKAEVKNGAAKPSRRSVYWNGGRQDAAVHLRGDLGRGATIVGPAIIEQEDTTILVLSGWRGEIDATGNLVLQRDAS